MSNSKNSDISFQASVASEGAIDYDLQGEMAKKSTKSKHSKNKSSQMDYLKQKSMNLNKAAKIELAEIHGVI